MSEQSYQFNLGIGSRTFSSWSLRAWLIMVYAGLPFTLKTYYFDEDAERVAFKADSRTGLVPFLTISENQGKKLIKPIQIADSYAIGEFMAELAPHLWPEDQNQRAMARMICCAIHSGIMRLREECPMNLSTRFTDFNPSIEVTNEVEALESLLNPFLEARAQAGHSFLFGNQPAMVDAFMTPVASRIHSFHLKASEHFYDYCDSLLSQAAMKDWLLEARYEQTDPERLKRSNGRFGAGLKTIGEYHLLDRF